MKVLLKLLRVGSKAREIFCIYAIYTNEYIKVSPAWTITHNVAHSEIKTRPFNRGKL